MFLYVAPAVQQVQPQPFYNSVLQVVIGVLVVVIGAMVIALGKLIVKLRDTVTALKNEVIPPPETNRPSLFQQIQHVDDKVDSLDLQLRQVKGHVQSIRHEQQNRNDI